LPMGLKRNLYDLSFVGIKIWFLKTYGMWKSDKNMRHEGQKQKP
jgi:hypothetical protein